MASTVTNAVINALKQVLPTERFHLPAPDDPYCEFDSMNDTYRSRINGLLEPDCYFMPENKEDVATFVRIVKPYALDGEGRFCFAIASGSRQLARGCNNIKNGITIHLGNLLGVEVDSANDIVRVAAGELWGKVYNKLREYGLAAAGGFSDVSGVAGTALQGTPAFFPSQEGFICDSVINYEVVLASGEIVNANAEENADLWKALRGGGNNLGIVTRFDMRTYKQETIFGGIISYSAVNFELQIEALVAQLINPNPALDKARIMITSCIDTHGKEIGLNHVYVNEPASEWPREMNPFVQFSSMMEDVEIRQQTLAMAVEEVDHTYMARGVQDRYLCINMILPPDYELLSRAWNEYSRTLIPVYEQRRRSGLRNTMRFSMSLQPYTRSMMESSARKGGNSLGFNAARGPLVCMRLLAGWSNVIDDGMVMSMLENVTRSIKRYAGGNLRPFVEGSHSEYDASIGHPDLEDLRDASIKYDPDRLFQIGVPGGYKLTTGNQL